MVMIVAIENADLQIAGTIRTKTSQTVMVVKLSVASRTRGGATGSKGHELVLLQGAILSQTMVLSRARHDF